MLKIQSAIPATAGRLKARVDNIFHLIEVYPECTIIELKGKDKYPHAFEEELMQQERAKDTAYNEALDKEARENDARIQPKRS